MEQIPGSDAVFLAMETDAMSGHIGGLTVLDPIDAPDFGFERLADFVSERIALAPRFHWVVRTVPLGLDRPYWVEDPDFDARRHLHRIAVPSPGGMRELSELASWIFSRKLEFDRPPWEIWYIEGLADGRVGLLMKMHHALMDGIAGAGLGELLCDLTPNPPPRENTGPVYAEADAREPSAAEMAWNGLKSWAGLPARLLNASGDLARSGVGTLSSLFERDGTPLPYFDVPRTSFNREIGPRRGFSCASVSLDEVKAVKKHFDVTVNDVVLAITGTALRNYLQKRDELPEQPLVALIAVSTREEGDKELGNQVDMMPVAWATNLEDPVERLRKIHRHTTAAKDRRGGASLFETLGDLVAPAFASLVFRSSSMAVAFNPGNVLVSNVRGTPVPLYLAGARIDSMYPMSILSHGQGINITVVSYMGRVDVGFTVDPDLVPEPWTLAAEIPGALEELQRAAGVELERVA